MDGWTQQMGYPLIVFDQQNDTNIYTIKQERYYQAVSVSNMYFVTNISSLYNTEYKDPFFFIYIRKYLWNEWKVVYSYYFEIEPALSQLLLPSANNSAQKGWVGLASLPGISEGAHLI